VWGGDAGGREGKGEGGGRGERRGGGAVMDNHTCQHT